MISNSLWLSVILDADAIWLGIISETDAILSFVIGSKFISLSIISVSDCSEPESDWLWLSLITSDCLS